MATVCEQEQRGAHLLYSLFQQYAARVPGNGGYGARRMSYIRMKELMLDMELLEGVPPGLTDVFVREHLQRADQEGSGVIGAQDFLVWLLTEVAALLPLRDAFCRVTGLRPLYNQFHAVLLGDVGFTDGARRPATGMGTAQWQRLAEEWLGMGGSGSGATGSGGGSGSAEGVRHAFKAARASLGAFRASSGANTGAQMAEPAGGGRLQFAAFVRALAVLAAQRMGSLDAALFQVVSCGALPDLTDPRVTKPPAGQAAALTRLGLESRLEGGTTRETYCCANCGQEHTRWRLENWVPLEELLLSLGIPHPVRRFLPALPLINTRNLRAAFHRYNAMYNKGKMPPTSYKLPEEEEEEAAGHHAAPAATDRGDVGVDGSGDGAGGATGGGTSGHVSSRRAGGGGGCCSGGGGGGGCCSQPAAYGACCCLFRSLSVMEMSSWLRLCGDCDAIRELIATHGSGVTPGSLEYAFLQAASIAGVYCTDDSSGIHDLPIPLDEGGAKLGLPRNALGAVVGSEARAAPDKPPPKRSNAAYQAAPDGHPMAATHAAMRAAAVAEAAAPASGGGGGGGDGTDGGASRPPWLHQVHGPNSAAAWLASAKSLPYDDGGGGGATPRTGRGQQHRPARLALTFPQFLEALRLVAEEAGGHPTRTAAAERSLLRIVHDVVREGCPRPDPTTATGTAQLRRQRLLRAGGGGASGGGGGRGVPPLPQDSLEGSRHPGSVANGGDGGKNGGGGGDDDGDVSARRLQRLKGSFGSITSSSASTSTKYTYDDFTPPDSERYTSATSATSASSSRMEQRGSQRGAAAAAASSHSLASQSWRPQPVKALGNIRGPTAAAAAAAGRGGGDSGGGEGGGGGGGARALPSDLQPKHRGGGNGGGGGGAAATAAAAPPGGPSAWVSAMPPPPSARMRPGVASGATNGEQPRAGGSSGGASEPRATVPSGASRAGQPPAATAYADRVEYVGSAGYGAVGGAVGGGGGYQLSSRPRPASARPLAGPTAAPAVGGYGTGAGTGAAVAASPPFAPRARPASASVSVSVSAQRSRPYTTGDPVGSSVRRPSSPPSVAPAAPPVLCPATAAAAAAAPPARTVWEPAGISGQPQVRPRSGSSAPRPRPASANALAARTAGVLAGGGRQPCEAGAGWGPNAAPGASAGGGGMVGFTRPLSRVSYSNGAAGSGAQPLRPQSPFRGTGMGPAPQKQPQYHHHQQQQQQPLKSAATPGGGAPTRPPVPESASGRNGSTSGNGRPASGIGFVTPLVLLPHDDSDRAGAAAAVRPPSQLAPPKAGAVAAAAVAADLRAEAAGAAALAAAAAARQASFGRRPPRPDPAAQTATATTCEPYAAGAATVHPSTSTADPSGSGNVGGPGDASGSGSSSRRASAASMASRNGLSSGRVSGDTQEPTTSSLPAAPAPAPSPGSARSESGLRNHLLLLQGSVEAVGSNGDGGSTARARSLSSSSSGNSRASAAGAGPPMWQTDSGGLPPEGGRPQQHQQHNQKPTAVRATTTTAVAVPPPPPSVRPQGTLGAAASSEPGLLPYKAAGGALAVKSDPSPAPAQNNSGGGGGGGGGKAQVRRVSFLQEGADGEDGGRDGWVRSTGGGRRAGGIAAAAPVSCCDDDVNSTAGGGGFDADDADSRTEAEAAVSPRAALAASLVTARANAGAGVAATGGVVGARTRLPAEGTVNGLQQYFFA